MSAQTTHADATNSGHIKAFVYFATSHDYYGRQHFYQSFAHELAARLPTYVVSGARIGVSKRGDVTRPRPNLTVINPRIPKGFSRVSTKALRDRLIATQVTAALRYDGLDDGSVLVIGQTTDMYPFSASTLPAASVYLVADEVVDRRERHVLDSVDVVVAGSPVCYERYKAHRRIFEVQAGVETEQYEAAADSAHVPSDVVDLPRPLLGYAGSVTTHRIDFTYLEAVADTCDGTVVLVGPTLGDPEPLERFSGRTNVAVLGHRDADAAPHYVAAFDVGLVPYLLTPFNLGCNPNKFYEYLASGLPVVSTRLPSLEAFSPALVSIADSPEAFAAATQRLVGQREIEQVQDRQRVARQFSMPALVNRIVEICVAELRLDFRLASP